MPIDYSKYCSDWKLINIKIMAKLKTGDKVKVAFKDKHYNKKATVIKPDLGFEDDFHVKFDNGEQEVYYETWLYKV